MLEKRNILTRLICIALCVLFFSNSYSQNTFGILLPVDEPGGRSKAIAVAETDSAFHIVSMKAYKSNGLDTMHNIIQKISKIGVFKSDWTLGVDTSYLHASYWYHIADFEHDQKWMGAGYNTPNNSYYRNIYRFSPSFDTIDKIVNFQETDSISLNGIKYFEDGTLIIGHKGHTSSYGGFVRISKIDTLGTTIWTTDIKPPFFYPLYFAYTDHSISYYDICATEDNGYFVSSYFTQDNSSNSFYLISKLDSLGNNTWNKLVRDAYHQSIPGNIIYRDTNSYIVTWAGYPLINRDAAVIGTDKGSDSLSIWMGEMDLAGNFKWKKQFYNVASNCDTVVANNLYIPYDILELADGNYLICVDFLLFDATYIKVSPLGDVIWNRRISILDDANADAQQAFLNIKYTTQTQDGGFIGVGEYSSTPSTMFPNGTLKSAVIKLDEYGCLEPGCQLEGCTDPSATNYNPDAVYDCGCQYNPCPDEHKITVKMRNFFDMDVIDCTLSYADNSNTIIEYKGVDYVSTVWATSTKIGCFEADCYQPIELYIDYYAGVPPNGWFPFASSNYNMANYFAYFKVFIDDSLILDIGDKIFRKHDTTFYINYCPYDTTTPVQIEYSIYPNPVLDNFTFTIPTKDFSLNHKYELMVYDKIGRVVILKKLDATQTTIPFKKGSSGAYTAILRKNDEVVFTKKIIKL